MRNRTTVLLALFTILALTLSASLSPVLAQEGARLGAASEGQVFPAEGISAPPYTPYGGAGIESSPVTFNGLWGGSCSVWGTDNYHASPTSYTAGTFRMTVDGMGNLTGYCIDVQHSVVAQRLVDGQRLCCPR